MITRAGAAVALSAAALVTLTSCTGGASTPSTGVSGSTSTSPGSAATSGPAVSTSPTSAEPATAPVATCSPSATTLTYHARYVALAGKKYVLGPGHRNTPNIRLPTLRTLRSRAPGLGSGSGLISALEHHWGLSGFARLGVAAKPGTPGSFGLPKVKHDVGLVVLAYVRRFTGSFHATCGGHRIVGHYTTFDQYGIEGVRCDEPSETRRTRLGDALC